jgi:hypothetical protein
VDNDGNPLLVGALYFDTTTTRMRVWTGVVWIDTGTSINGTAARWTYTATGGQTTFTAVYDVGYVDVYLNGVKQVLGTDFSASSGTNIVFASGLTAGDNVDIVGYGIFQVANTYTQAQSDARYRLVLETPRVISVNTNATRFERYVLTASLTLVLPASPVSGEWVGISNLSGTTTCVVSRNGQNIMGLAADLTLDAANAVLTLMYVDSTRGWIFI